MSYHGAFFLKSKNLGWSKTKCADCGVDLLGKENYWNPKKKAIKKHICVKCFDKRTEAFHGMNPMDWGR